MLSDLRCKTMTKGWFWKSMKLYSQATIIIRLLNDRIIAHNAGNSNNSFGLFQWITDCMWTCGGLEVPREHALPLLIAMPFISKCIICASTSVNGAVIKDMQNCFVLYHRLQNVDKLHVLVDQYVFILRRATFWIVMDAESFLVHNFTAKQCIFRIKKAQFHLPIFITVPEVLKFRSYYGQLTISPNLGNISIHCNARHLLDNFLQNTPSLYFSYQRITKNFKEE
ncbi:hypothetical protein LOAG_08892 [Loa loa]|uniref:Uncharacterized protein n=1 Tax=Loa loa TaxID=7209 RepID=A0A1S0TTE8_LOALO|nr:hypothetical protein LOAG_08892 [Loa loa]EFO19600.1 hypothetical protein LOAG_08892 [Loa loa]